MASSLLTILTAALAPLVLAVTGPVATDLARRRPARLPPACQWLPLAATSPRRGVVAACVGATFGVRWASQPFAWLVVLAVLAVAVLAARVDRRCHRLPDVLVGPLGAGVVVAIAGWSLVTGNGVAGVRAVVASIVAAGVLGVGWVLGMGLGDVKFGAVLAAVLGWSTLSPVAAVAVALGMVGLAAAGASAWWVWGAVVHRRTPRWFPFGPFLLAAAVCWLLVLGPPPRPDEGTGSPCVTGPPVDSGVCSDS